MPFVSFRSLLILTAWTVLWIGGTAAAEGSGGRAAAECPAGTSCDRVLGVALTPPRGWQRIPAGHFPPHTLAWFAGPPLGLDYNVRLLIGPDGTTSKRDEWSAAATAVDGLVRGYRGIRTTRYPVRYGGAPGFLIRGLPGSPGPAAIIILVHQGTLYSIIAPGAVLFPDQRQALASLRFIPRVGRLPHP